MKYSTGARPLVLVVDDDSTVLTEIAEVLERANFASRCCTASAEALAAAAETPPDLILCDVNLQGHSGLELCREIQRLPGMENVPVMFLSGAQLPDVIRRSHRDGGIYCLRKPFDPTVLLELIDQALAVLQP